MVDLKQNNSGIGEVLDITLRFKVSLESWQMVEEFLTMFNWILKYLEYMLLYYVHLCTRWFNATFLSPNFGGHE